MLSHTAELQSGTIAISVNDPISAIILFEIVAIVKTFITSMQLFSDNPIVNVFPIAHKKDVVSVFGFNRIIKIISMHHHVWI